MAAEEFYLPRQWEQLALPMLAGGMAGFCPGTFQLPGHTGALRKGLSTEKGDSHPIVLRRRRARTESGEGQSMEKKMREVKGDLPGKELREPASSWAVSVCCSYVGCRVEKNKLQPGGGRLGSVFKNSGCG